MFGMLERHSDIRLDRRFVQFSVGPSDQLDFRRSYRKVFIASVDRFYDIGIIDEVESSVFIPYSFVQKRRKFIYTFISANGSQDGMINIPMYMFTIQTSIQYPFSEVAFTIEYISINFLFFHNRKVGILLLFYQNLHNDLAE